MWLGCLPRQCDKGAVTHGWGSAGHCCIFVKGGCLHTAPFANHPLCNQRCAAPSVNGSRVPQGTAATVAERRLQSKLSTLPTSDRAAGIRQDLVPPGPICHNYKGLARKTRSILPDMASKLTHPLTRPQSKPPQGTLVRQPRKQPPTPSPFGWGFAALILQPSALRELRRVEGNPCCLALLPPTGANTCGM